MNALWFLIGTTRARCLALASSLAWASLAGCADTSPECRDLLAQAHERAEAGNLDAQFKLGQMYEHGECVAVDMQAAAKWYRQAAASGHAGAQKVLGFMYAGGVGLEEDTKQAVYWFRKAAEQGHPEA
ncbi:MAG: tetratricopeptide repeat protein, partial [Nitrospiraceae bacterium]